MVMEFEKYKHLDYAWPHASCIALIEDLSSELPKKPDYSAVKAKSEARNLAEIRQMPGDPFMNYIGIHRKCLEPAWKQADFDTDFQAGDLVFARYAAGTYVRRDNFGSVKWQSKPHWPVTMFHDGFRLWTFTEAGLKIVHDYREVVCWYRRNA